MQLIYMLPVFQGIIIEIARAESILKIPEGTWDRNFLVKLLLKCRLNLCEFESKNVRISCFGPP